MVMFCQGEISLINVFFILFTRLLENILSIELSQLLKSKHLPCIVFLLF